MTQTSALRLWIASKALGVPMGTGGPQDPGWWARFWLRRGMRQSVTAGDEVRPFSVHESTAGAAVTPDNALRLSATWDCVRKRSDTISTLPVHVKRADKTFADQHPVFDLLHRQPNPDMTSAEFFACIVACLDLWGNSYALKTLSRLDGSAIALNPLIPEYMTVRRNAAGRMRFNYKPPTDPVGTDYDEQEIIHFRGFSLDGLVGLSPIEYAAESIGSQIAANDAHSGEFRNGLKIGGYIEAPAGVTITKEQRRLWRERMAEFSAPENAAKWMLFEAGFKPVSGDKIRMNPQVAQLLEARGFGIEEICRAFGVPPPLIGHTDKASSWASSLTNLNQFFLTYSIQPTLTRIEQRLEVGLLSRDERRSGLSIKFNFRGLLRGSFSEQMTAYGQALDRGIYSVDDVRDYEDEPALPDGKGKEYRVPLNTAPIAAAPAPNPAASAPAPAPQPQNANA